MKEVALSSLKPGQKARVVAIKGEAVIRKRLYDMGVTPNLEVKVEKVAPLADPIEISLRGYRLSLRKSEASTIIVTL